MAGYRQDLGDIYIGITEGKQHKSDKKLSEMYRDINRDNIVSESKKSPVVTTGEDSITVFFTDSEDTIAQLKQTPGIESRSMSREYFKAGILGRLDERMSKVANDLVIRSLGGKSDLVALRGIYEVLQKYHISGEHANDLLTNITDTIESGRFMEDFLTQSIHQVTTWGVVHVVDQLVANCEQYGLNQPGVDLAGLVNELWDVKDVEGRTSVGKGELAMCVLSVARKGEPGDVKVGEEVDGVIPTKDQRLLVGDKKNISMAIEVKGTGGRPGTDNGAHRFVSRVLAIENTEDNTRPATVSYNKIPSTPEGNHQRARIDAIQRSLRGVTAGDLWEAFFDDLAARGNKVANFSSPDNQVIGRTYLEELNEFVNQPENFYPAVARNLNKLKTTTLSWLTEWIKKWAKLAKLDAKGNQRLWVGKHAKFLAVASKKGLFNMMWERESLIGDAASALKTLDKKFKEAVETYFTVLCKGPNDNTLGKSEDVIAEALWATRPDVPDMDLPEDVRVVLKEIVSQNPGVLFHKDPLGQLIAAVQMTSYCAHDKFTQAMFVDDTSEKRSSLVVRTNGDNLGATFSNMYNAFVDKGVKAPLSIDKQNKGVQIKFSESR